MLPRASRLHTSGDFGTTIRRGTRVARPTLVLHVGKAPSGGAAGSGVRVGLVVSKTVGNAVTRNRVKRRLRHLAAEHLTAGPASGLDVVIRALPAAASAGTALTADLTRAWAKAQVRLS